MSGPTIILNDADGNGSFSDEEIIVVSEGKKKPSLTTASDRVCNHMKICPQKERILDKSYEL